ncbi:MAG: hypothetical protein GEV03_22295 [Streptosporangiales bacterium]|nr:hypothetical protein [Streptosporangiales bacterium]
MTVTLSEPDLCDARPNGANAASLHRHLRERLGDSTVALLNSASAGLGTDLASLNKRCAQLDLSRALSPAVFIAHYALLDAITRNDSDAVRASIASLSAFGTHDWYAPGRTVDTVGATSWEESVLARLRAHPVPDRFGRMTVIDPLSDDALAGYRADVDEALALIEAADPQMRTEVDEFVRHVCLSRGSGITGATSLQFFGAVFLREPYPEYHRVMYFFEHLVHETSHLRLNVVQTADPLVLNPPDELHRSPLRRDPRPVMGIFHAQFVLSRLVHIYRRAIPLVDAPIFADHAKTIEDKFQRGIGTLNEVGSFTETGRKLLDSMAGMAE